MLGSKASGRGRLLLGSGATIVLGIALSVARDYGRWDRSAVAVMVYGGAAGVALSILTRATARGRVAAHVAFIAAVSALGLALPSLLDPRDYLLGVDRYFGWVENRVCRTSPTSWTGSPAF